MSVGSYESRQRLMGKGIQVQERESFHFSPVLTQPKPNLDLTLDTRIQVASSRELLGGSSSFTYPKSISQGRKPDGGLGDFRVGDGGLQEKRKKANQYGRHFMMFWFAE